jgi:hypothetical protein
MDRFITDSHPVPQNNSLRMAISWFAVEIGSAGAAPGPWPKQKGSHRVFEHPKLAERESLSGADGEDLKNDEEKNVGRRIGNAQKTKQSHSAVSRLVR